MSVVITRTITLGLIRVISDLLGAGEGSRDHVPPSTSLIGSCSCTTNASTTNSFSFARVAGSLTGSPLLSSSPLPTPPPPSPTVSRVPLWASGRIYNYPTSLSPSSLHPSVPCGLFLLPLPGHLSAASASSSSFMPSLIHFHLLF